MQESRFKGNSVTVTAVIYELRITYTQFKKLRTQNSELKTRNSEPRTLRTQNSELGARNSELGAWNQIIYTNLNHIPQIKKV